ncbi:hypothetical protein [Hymenobacter metallilatus]|uniref:Uncharacterized protein n=1 Tax=Hymenobacter metallilatus TaxID=2493666 RepID=A0A3R9PCN2_9BACT|nr:hypothetical protein [Hymenobacter metallilatus]RSK33917.1 hypothetical protein EI290_09435 [Hymenobacter metallilatus]
MATDNNQDPAAALNPDSGANLTDAQRKHREELYGYQRDEEGTLDTSARLEAETTGIPTDSATTGPDPDNSSMTDELMNPGFNNPIDDNNR